MIDARLIKRLRAGPDSEAFELNIHLRSDAGLTVLFGPSGAGKTLTLNCVAGFARPEEGRILVNGTLFFDAAAGLHLAPQRRHCGYIFQDHALFPHMTVRDNLRFAAHARTGSKGRLNRHRRINELLEAFELTDLSARKSAQLSGGQRQRAAIARALAGEPRLLLLDEPARGLDVRLRQNFHQILKRTRDLLKIPILLVTHDLEECLELADNICLIEHGKQLQAGPNKIVIENPANVEAARLLGIYNVIPAEIMALDPGRNTSRLKVMNFEIEGPYFPAHLIGDRGFLCVRQSDIQVLPHALNTANEITLKLTGKSASPAGAKLLFEHDVIAMSTGITSGTQEEARIGELLRLRIPRSAVYFIGSQ